MVQMSMTRATNRPSSRLLQNLPLILWVLAALAFGYSLDRYPSFYMDEAFFVYPALRAALGGPFRYAISHAAPFADQTWAYHSPVLPHIELALFKMFGYSIALSRLPDFLGGWIAVLLLLVYLRNRFRYAALTFIVLWCGDRSPEELMYGRMDGLALLTLVLTLLCLEKASAGDRRWAVATGFCASLAVLVHPLCLTFTAVAFLLLAYRARVRSALLFLLGAIVNLFLLVLLWHFNIRESLIQFRWHASLNQSGRAIDFFVNMVNGLRWSRYWFLALIPLTLLSLSVAIFLHLRGRGKDPRWTAFISSACFGLAALPLIYRSATHPYYIVFFAAWPIFCLAVLAERRWSLVRPVFAVLLLIWVSSAAWNVLRLREAFKYHAQLSPRFLNATLQNDVPANAELITVPELYGVPVQAGHTHFSMTSWFPEAQDVPDADYILIPESELAKGGYIAQHDLKQRTILYEGSAFPGAGPLDYMIVLLAPGNHAIHQ